MTKVCCIKHMRTPTAQLHNRSSALLQSTTCMRRCHAQENSRTHGLHVVSGRLFTYQPISAANSAVQSRQYTSATAIVEPQGLYTTYVYLSYTSVEEIGLHLPPRRRKRQADVRHVIDYYFRPAACWPYAHKNPPVYGGVSNVLLSLAFPPRGSSRHKGTGTKQPSL